MTKAAVMVPRLEKKIYVMSCVCFRMHKHLFTRGLQEREGWSWRVGWGGWQPGLCNQRPEPGERTEEGAALISANYMYPVHLVGHR